MKKKVIGFFTKAVIFIICIVVVAWLLNQSYGYTVLEIMQWLLMSLLLVFVGFAIYFYVKNAPLAKKNRENIAEIMDATLNSAAGDKAAELHGQVYGVITRLIDQTNMNVPCFVALTNDKLIIAPLSLIYVPYSWVMVIPFTTLTKCIVKSSLMPVHHVVKLRFENKKCALRLYDKPAGFHALTQQKANNEILLEGLRKIESRIALREQ